MDLNALKKLVGKGESLFLEFKTKASNPEKIARELVAFANTKGGVLLIGVEDNKTIAGCKYPEEEIYVITRHFEAYCPDLVFHLERIPVSNKREVIALHVKEHTTKPVFLKDVLEEKKKNAYVRVADMSIVASTEMEIVLRYEKDKRDWKFYYGKREETIVRYLSDHASLSLSQAQELLKLPRKPTAITMVALVRAGLVKLQPGEQGDLFVLEEKAFE